MCCIRLVMKRSIFMIRARQHVEKAQHFNSKDDMIGVLTSDLKAHDRVLVKGSRGMKLEEVVNALIS